jgi:predicted metal-dependent phosphoesterase TrpH
VPLIELHLHTKAGSADSSIRVDDLGERARELDIGGLVVTEHFRVWSDWERSAFFDRWGVRVYRATEVTTDLGHVIVIGVPAGKSLPGSAEALLALARREGWRTVLAHPFRHYFDDIHPGQRPAFPPGLPAEQLAALPIFALVDSLEVENAACIERENALAFAVASLARLPATAGSDAHDLREVGTRTLAVPSVPADEGELCDLLAALAPEDVLNALAARP